MTASSAAIPSSGRMRPTPWPASRRPASCSTTAPTSAHAPQSMAERGEAARAPVMRERVQERVGRRVVRLAGRAEDRRDRGEEHEEVERMSRRWHPRGGTCPRPSPPSREPACRRPGGRAGASSRTPAACTTPRSGRSARAEVGDQAIHLRTIRHVGLDHRYPRARLLKRRDRGRRAGRRRATTGQHERARALRHQPARHLAGPARRGRRSPDRWHRRESAEPPLRWPGLPPA